MSPMSYSVWMIAGLMAYAVYILNWRARHRSLHGMRWPLPASLFLMGPGGLLVALLIVVFDAHARPHCRYRPRRR